MATRREASAAAEARALQTTTTGKAQRKGKAKPSGRVAVVRVSPQAGSLFPADAPVQRVVAALGNNAVAAILGVSPSQPSRWKSGKERISPENRKRISDLDHILDRLLLELHADQAGLWLTGPNPHLGGARPIDALEVCGPGAVINALDALAAGAFA